MAKGRAADIVIPESFPMSLGVSYNIVEVENLRDDEDKQLEGQIDWWECEIRIAKELPLHEKLAALGHEIAEDMIRATGEKNVLPYEYKEKLCDIFGNRFAEMLLSGALVFGKSQ